MVIQSNSSVIWIELEKRYNKSLLLEIQKRVLSGVSLEIDENSFLSGGLYKISQVIQILDELYAYDLINKSEVIICPVVSCNNQLDADDLENKICPSCKSDFDETGDKPRHQIKYFIKGKSSRSVHWMIAVHGMNTDGRWQEELSWRISNKFKYHAPVLIYKYGLYRYRVLFRRCHSGAVKSLGNRIIKARDLARENGISDPPDIIVHSFGSLIFSLLLQSDDYLDLKFGRVVVVGGIIRPDFPWNKYIDSKRVEAVLNCCGGKDKIVGWAQFFIPNSGPSGALGFQDNLVINIAEKKHGHSAFFLEKEISKNLKNAGAWDVFFKYPLSSLEASLPLTFNPGTWRPAPAFMRVAMRCFMISFPWILVWAIAWCSSFLIQWYCLR